MLAALLLALNGCSGAPVEPPAPSGPGRPRDLPLDGIAPCELPTGTQRADLGLGDEALDHNGGDPLFGNTAACSFRGFQPRAISFGIRLSTERGIDTFDGTDPPGTPIEIAGFPGGPGSGGPGAAQAGPGAAAGPRGAAGAHPGMMPTTGGEGRRRPSYLVDDSGAFDVEPFHVPPVIGGDDVWR